MDTQILIAGSKSSNEKINAAVILSASMTHELRNYLVAIGICTALSEQRLKTIRDICVQLSKEELKNIKQRLKSAEYLIQTLQMQIKSVVTGKLDTANFKQYSILNIVRLP